MSLIDTKHKRKSLAITTTLLIGLLLLMFYVGLSYLDPPIENGITVNFGVTDYGSGNNQPVERVKTAPQPKQEMPREVEPVKAEEQVEDVITSEQEDVPVIPPKKSTPKDTPKEEPKKEEVKEVVQEPKKPSKTTTDALSSIINGPENDGKASGSEGDDKVAGDKGQPDGNPYASSYFGGGAGNGVGYGLNGRSLVSRKKFVQDCNESGVVVVQIEVDRTGKVVRATPGVKGTTNNAPCLLEPAKRTAMSHRWNLDEDAPSRQIGFVVVNFRLGE
ncbi:hypothetical protein SAMN04487906_3353 [Zhouia amylolytica]|uniref:Protein TonB, links inner and outer membranes n=1 Tax=Zhouia amylolytica TaxID=376730 RepID=A0A1I6VTG4_9FLAO|nr:energy transducer TonB [Zhouia amylolytica]SFT17023.1 hypothetical protein SAMN04487906_3353 [Zhouia amylolytica]